MAAKTSARKILLTGVTRGLGLAMAEAFVAGGHTVWGCGRNAGQIAALGQRWSAPHRFAVVDVGDDAQVASWARETLAAGGPPDLLINNAALINDNAPLWKVSAPDFDRLLRVNISGTANVIRHFVPAMIARGAGVIVNFSSGWGRSTSAEVAPYCATKWAIEGLTQALAQELPEGMAAVPLNPGIIDTDMLRQCFGDGASSYPTPERWAAKAAPYLLSLGASDNGHPRSVG
jgi:NAD(P)-dependent dehydrogenase (short-subunit alcohol dehydrogenase family)